MANLLPDILKLLLAVLVGGVIGVEREFRHKVAGFRTNIFICVGATLFTVFALRFSVPGDAVHIIANIVSGVGFIGAGVVLRQEGRVVGLTTAAMIWLTAALGMGIGTGDYALVGAATVAVVIILLLFPGFERRIDQYGEARSYGLVCALKTDTLHRVERLLPECHLQLRSQKREKRGDKLIWTLDLWGSTPNHDGFTDRLLADAEIEELHLESGGR